MAILHEKASKELISYIIDKGTDVNAMTDFGFNLECAISNKRLDIAKLLIEKGADANLALNVRYDNSNPGYYDNIFEYAKKQLGKSSVEYKDFVSFATMHEAKKIGLNVKDPEVKINTAVKAEDMEVDKNTHIYLATASTHLDKEGGRGTGSGDIDYTKTLEQSLKKSLGKESNVHYLQGMNNEKVIFEHIEKNTPTSDKKVLHMMINAPTIGFVFSEQGLKKFKENGGIIVATAIEFASRNATPNLKPDTLKYFSYADQVIFLDENDKKQAIEYQQRHDKNNRALNNKLLESQIINVPPTVPVSDKKPEERGHDIISFGMIRAGKGFAHVRKLAELIKNSNDPLMKDKKILIVGTVQKDKISRDGKNYSYDGELYKLMKDIYPEKADELYNKNPKELKEL